MYICCFTDQFWGGVTTFKSYSNIKVRHYQNVKMKAVRHLTEIGSTALQAKCGATVCLSNWFAFTFMKVCCKAWKPHYTFTVNMEIIHAGVIFAVFFFTILQSTYIENSPPLEITPWQRYENISLDPENCNHTWHLGDTITKLSHGKNNHV